MTDSETLQQPELPTDAPSTSRRRTFILAGVASGLGGAGLAWWRGRHVETPQAVKDPVEGFWMQQWERPEGGVVRMQALRGRPLLINFWATWCPPCVASIPHLAELQAKLKPDGVQVISIHVSSGVEAADAYVRKNTKQMDYTVAKDTNGAMGKAWMDAAGQNGIPCSFVVAGGKIAYIGHPASLTDEKIRGFIEEAKTAAPAAPVKK